MGHMRKWTFTILLLTFIWSCDKDDEMKAKDKLIGNWEHNLTERGLEYVLSGLPPSEYHFNADKTFIKDFGASGWRDEGTWTYEEGTGVLSLSYKTYTYQESDTKSLDLKIEKITDKELVFKVDYNDTNISGEFVEFEFIHYLKK
jgi:hypothetical protein